MASDVIVAGVSRKADIDLRKKIVITLQQNERSQMKFTTRWNANWKPARFASAVAYEVDGSTPVFTGFVFRRKTKGKGTEFHCTEVTCLDFWYYFDRTDVVLEYTEAVTAEEVVDDLVAQLPVGYGITKDAAQETGPTLAPFTYRGTATGAIRDLGKRCNGWVGQLSAGKELRVLAPGSSSAPYAITDADPHCTSVEVEDSDVPPSNRAVLWCGPAGNALARQQWEADGSETSWVTDIPAAAAPPLVYVNDGVNPASLKTVGAGADFEFDVPTSTLSVGTYGTPTSGTILVLGSTDEFPGQEGYLARFPFKVEAATGATPVLTETRYDTSITEFARGQEAVATLLDEVNQDPDVLSVESRDQGWRPGQALTVELTTPPVDSTFAIGPVTISMTTDELWRYSFTATEATVFQGSKLDLWRKVVSSIASGGAATSSFSSGGSSGGSGTSGIGLFVAFLGGQRNAPTPLSHSEWRTIKNHVPLPALAVEWAGRIRVDTWTRNTGITFKVGLWNTTDNTLTAESSFVTPGNDPNDPVDITFTCVVPAGKDHDLRVMGEGIGDNDEDAYTVATIATV